MATMVHCPFCGKLTDPKLDACPHCGGVGKNAASARPQPRQKQVCPTCRAPVGDGDIICIACGTNLLTGQKLVEEKPPARKARPRQKRERSVPWATILVVLAGTLVLIGIVVGGIALIAWTSDPVAKGQRLAAQGRTSEARSVLEAHAQAHPDNARASFELAKVLWATGQYDAAEQAFTRAAQLDRQNLDAGRFAVLSAMNMRNLDRETSTLERYVAQAPKDPLAIHLLALARATAAGPASRDLTAQIAALEAAVAQDPSAAQLKKTLGLLLALQGDHARAASQLNDAAGLLPNDPDIAAAQALVVSLQEKPSDTSSERLEAALAGRTTIEKEATVELAALRLAQGRVDEAQQLLKDAAAKGVNDPSLRFFSALCLQAKRSNAQALDEFETLTQGEGFYAAAAAVQAAQIYSATDRREKALDALDRAGTLGGDPAVLNTVRGRIHMKAGEDSAAQDAFRRAILADDGYAPAHLEYGLLMVRRQSIAEGIRELERYLELVGPETGKSSTQDVRTLVDQLKQTVSAQSPAQTPSTAPAHGGARQLPGTHEGAIS